MAEELDFSLPEQQAAKAGIHHRHGVLTVLVVLQTAILVAAAFKLWLPDRPGSDVTLSGDEWRDLALTLEKRGMPAESSQAWQKYLTAIHADRQKAAKIWFRIGVAYQNAAEYSAALAAYYQSEAFGDVDSIQDELSRRVQECLESSGRFAALRQDLKERVSIGSETSDGGASEVLAEVGATRITEAFLDRQTERLIEAQLARMAPMMDQAQLNARKQQLLKQLSSGSERVQMLQQYLGTELLYRKAREDGLASDPTVRELLRETERQILADQVMARELSRRITITPGDVEMFFKANPEAFAKPERRRIAHICVPDRDRALAVLKSLDKSTDFATLAREISLHEASRDKDGEMEGWIQADQASIPGIGKSSALIQAAFKTQVGAVCETPVQSDLGWHVIKVVASKPTEHPTFEDVQEDARRMLLARKRNEVQEQLLAELREHFDVVVHTDKLPQPEPQSGSK